MDSAIGTEEEDTEPMTALASRPATTQPATRGVGHLIAPMMVGAISAAGVAVTYHFFVQSITGQSIDTQALHNSDVGHARAIDIMERSLNGTSLASLILVCLAVALIGFMRRRIDLAIAAGVMVAGANLSARLLKTGLPRPELDGFPAPNSFPSGHTTAAASVAFALVLVLPAAIRGMVALIGAAYVTVIAVATVWAEWHRPSDTIAALLLVLAWGSAVSLLLRLSRIRRPGHLERPTRLTTILFAGGGVFATIVAGAGFAALTMSQRTDPDLVSGRFAFLTSAAAIVATVAITFYAWIRVSAGEETP